MDVNGFKLRLKEAQAIQNPEEKDTLYNVKLRGFLVEMFQAVFVMS